MKNNWVVIAVIVLVVIGLGVWIFSTNSSATPQDNSNTPANNDQEAQNTTPPQTGELFSSSPLAQYAYLISTATYDTTTKKALSGFNVVKSAQADGSTKITLNAQKAGYQTQVYTVKPGEKLYFIESNLSDDTATDTDKFPGDDQAVLVDANGYIVPQ